MWSLTTRKYLALVKVYEDDQYRQDLRSAMIRLDLRNIHCVGDKHPDAWTLEEVLPRSSAHQPLSDSDARIARWLASRPEPTPERRAWYETFKVRAAMAMAAKKWDGPEVWPLPS